MTTTSWTFSLLAMAVWFSGRARSGARRAARHPAGARGAPRPSSPTVARVGAGAATALACLAILGWPSGVVAAAVLVPGLVLLVRRLQAQVAIGLGRIELARLPLVLDLVAVALQSGQPVDAALLAAAASGGPRLAGHLRQVAGLLRLGAEPSAAWQGLLADPRLKPVAVTAVRSAGSGIRLAASFTDQAKDLRAEALSAAQGRAQRAGVWAIAPLGLCFLPAFVCVGIAPVVIGVARGILQSG